MLIPQGLGTLVFVLLSGRITKRVETRLLVNGGIALTMIGVIPFAFAGASGGGVLLLVGQFVQGVGLGACLLPISTLAFVGLAKAENPRASAAFSVVQRVGAPFGVTVVAVLLQGYLAHSGTAGAHVASAFHTTFWWVFGFSGVPRVLALFLPSVRKIQSARTAPPPAGEPAAELAA